MSSENDTKTEPKLAADLPTIGSKWTHASEPGIFVIADATTDGRVIWTEEGEPYEYIAPVRDFLAVFTEITAEHHAGTLNLTGQGNPEPVLYWCPTAREIETQPGGGFDTCCHAPELHEPVLAVVYTAIRQQIAEQIAAKGNEIAEKFQATAVTHRDLSHEHGNTLKGTSHMATAHAYRNKAEGAWAVMHAARDIGGQA